MSRIRNLAMLFTVLLGGHTFAATAAPALELSSGEKQVAMLELFTSEGCSSCPPADRWLSDLKANPELWTEFTPIAFHVDYWDYIGWKDRFATAEFSARQRRHISEGGARVVYTPGFFMDGDEWQAWRRGGTPIKNDRLVGDLELRVAGDEVVAQFTAADKGHGNLTLHIALLGMNIETEVRAGENRGRKLQHDFVALDVVSVPLSQTGSNYGAATKLSSMDTSVKAGAIVAWVASDGKQAPIQSVGGFLPGS